MDEVGENPVREGPATLGATLAAERERQGLGRADVAQRLHMSPTQVEALELGDYGHLPRGTFLRGFVRNYAKILGLAPDPLLEMLAGAAPPTPAPGIVVPTQNIRFDPLGERLSSPYVKAATLATVAIAIGFAAMYWAMYVRPRPQGLAMRAANVPAPAAPRRAAPAEAGTSAVPAPQAASEEAAQRASLAPAAAAPDGAAAERAAPEASPGSAPSSPAASKPAPAAKSVTPEAGADAGKGAGADASAAPRRLHFHFAGDSWVEVRDANGKVLFQKLNAAGTEAQLSARPPLQVVVGNAPEVEMTLDGKPFDLDPHTNVAVARFTLE